MESIPPGVEGEWKQNHIIHAFHKGKVEMNWDYRIIFIYLILPPFEKDLRPLDFLSYNCIIIYNLQNFTAISLNQLHNV